MPMFLKFLWMARLAAAAPWYLHGNGGEWVQTIVVQSGGVGAIRP